jgi:hypothetical protein
MTTVDDLQIVRSNQLQALIGLLHLDRVSGRAETVIIGKEHMRFIADRIANAPVHLVARLQKASNVGFEETRSPLVIYFSQLLARNHRQIAFERGIASGCCKKRNATAETLLEIDNQVCPRLALFHVLLEALQVPDAQG